MFERNKYLNQLISKENNHLIKVITGVRRSGKSFLLNDIFYNHLLTKEKINKKQIIKFAFDIQEDIIKLDKYYPDEPTTVKRKGQTIVNDRKFISYIQDQIKDNKNYYLLLDEIQNLNEFVRVLNGFIRHDNYDVYVTGSNSYLLSKDIDTEFSGRSSSIHLLPLSFTEYLSDSKLDKNESLKEYIRYGGIPLVQKQDNDEEKTKQSISVYKDTYLSDIKKRHPQVDEKNLVETLRVIASMISTPINPTRIENTFNSKYKISLSNNVIGNYINWFEDAFMLNKVMRYDVKGRSYIGSPYKIYFEDIGIRNAILNYREIDETDIIENIVYNELRYRGFNVDVGVVTVSKKTDRLDKNNCPIYETKDCEVDFVANKGSKTYYVQVTLVIDSEKKKDQEYESIRNIPDSFKKVIIVKEEGKHFTTSEGFERMSLLDFLMNEDSLDW